VAANRRPPESGLIATVVAVYQDGRLVPVEQAWLRFDVAQRFTRLQRRWEAEYGFALPVAALGRSSERALELAGLAIDGHVLGSAIDVSYNRLKAEFLRTRGVELPDRLIAEKLDPIAALEGFRPLGKTRWPDPAIKQKGDWQHYQTDDYGGARKIGPQAFASKQAAFDAIWTPKAGDFERLFAFATARGAMQA
jgi:hypothetical protein